jgi:hypothetical protein
MSDNDLGTYRSEYYDTMDPGVDEFGRSQTVMAVNRPPTAAPSGGRTYDLTPTPQLQGPYGPTEPLRPGTQGQAQLDPFRDPARPRTGVPYPVSMVSHEDMPDTSAPPYVPCTPLTVDMTGNIGRGKFDAREVHVRFQY